MVAVHIHIVWIQAASIDKLCSAIPQLATEKCPELEDQAQAVMNKYGRALLLYSKCHNIFNSSMHFDNCDLSTLRKNRTDTLVQLFYPVYLLQLVILMNSSTSIAAPSQTAALPPNCTCWKITLSHLSGSGGWGWECWTNKVLNQYMHALTLSRGLMEACKTRLKGLSVVSRSIFTRYVWTTSPECHLPNDQSKVLKSDCNSHRDCIRDNYDVHVVLATNY